MNNKYSYYKCTVCKKRDAWKICQATGVHSNAQHTSTYSKCKVCCNGGGPFPSLINEFRKILRPRFYLSNAAIPFRSSLPSAITAPSLRNMWPAKLGIEGHSRNGHWTLGTNALPPRCSFTRYASWIIIVIVLRGRWTTRLEISPLYPMIHEVEQ